VSIKRETFGEDTSLPEGVTLILENFDMFNDIEKQAEDIQRRIEELPTYKFDEIATQRLELLRSAFNQFQFEILSTEQQYCSSNMIFDLNGTISKIHLKIQSFDNEIKTLETYLYRNG
jgi:hypothetical protein